MTANNSATNNPSKNSHSKILNMNSPLKTIFKRELGSYFLSPIAYVFIAVFLLATVGCTFFIGNFFEANQASLHAFFLFHPWLYLVIVPAIGMRLWAEERNSGTLELLLTLPIEIHQAVIAKFLAGWVFIAIALSLTFLMPITVIYLGSPDYGAMLGGYLGSLLMAGSYLAISCATSAMTRNQVISFILSAMLCFLLTILGWGVFAQFLEEIFPAWLASFISSFSFITHFDSIRRGVVDFRDLMYFASIIIGGLWINIIILEAKREK